MTSNVFLSHNSLDKPFVRRLATDLDIQGIRCWLD
ncbi:toll/interleukin-1 receptor domain-containing protein [Acidovorax sp.]